MFLNIPVLLHKICKMDGKVHLNKSQAIIQLQQSIVTLLQNEVVSTYLFFPACSGHIFYYALRQAFFQNKLSMGIFSRCNI